MKKFLCLLMAMMMLIGCVALAEEAAPAWTFGPINLHQGRWTDLEKTEELRSDEWYLDASISDDYIWVYDAEKPYIDIMYAPMFIYYADVQTQEEAWDAMINAGLREKIEEKGGYVVVIGKAEGEAWNETHVDVYKGMEQWFLNEAGVVKYPELAFSTSSITFCQYNFVFAEGDAATFVNNYLTSYVDRISGLFLVSGEMSADVTAEGKLPVPAYLIDADKNALAYYKAVNDVDDVKMVGSDAVYFATDNDVQRVAVGAGDALNTSTFDAFWDCIGDHCARLCLYGAMSYDDVNKSDIPYELVKLPEYDEMDITVTVHTEGPLEGMKTENPVWYELVPDSVVEGDTSKKYALIVVSHGAGDFPLYECASQGWTDLMLKEDVILVAPEYTNGADNNILVDYMIEKYPVIDASRVYAVGFSMGGEAVSQAVTDNMMKYAGYSLMHTHFAGDLTAFQGNKIAFVYLNGARDRMFGPHSYFTMFQNAHVGALQAAADLNGVKLRFGADTDSDVFYGLGMYDLNRTERNGRVTLSKQFKGEDGIPYIQLSLHQDTDHIHFVGNADVIWDHLSHFSRAENGELIYTE